VVGRAYGTLPGRIQTVPLAELVGITVALQRTIGECHFVLDCQSVIDGIRHGPQWKHEANSAAWLDFWEAYEGHPGPCQFKKVKSHLEEGDVGVHITREDFTANQAADECASEGARMARLPQHIIQQVIDIDNKAVRVQRRLTEVALQVAIQTPSIYSATSGADRVARSRASRAQRQSNVEQALQETTHSVIEKGGYKLCVVCRGRPTKGCGTLEWLASLCPGRPHQIHQSHDVSCTRELWWCRKCGAYSSAKISAGLQGTCHRPTDWGKKVLSKLMDGRLPPGLKTWPDELGKGLGAG